MDNNQALEKEYGEYLLYLYDLASIKYSDVDDIDSLIMDSMLALIKEKSEGTIIEHSKGFLATVMKNKYNEYLRKKYKNKIAFFGYTSNINTNYYNSSKITLSAEYENVRREIGRLINIYREVTVRYYIHNNSIKQIAKDLCISEGTVKSRLSSARNQIKEGLNKMEKYSEFSYEPKSVSIGIWGSAGLSGEPFSLIHSEIEANILVLAYEVPVSIRSIADTMGVPSAYIEKSVEKLIKGELLGKTSGGLVYTRCFMINYDAAFGDIELQESLAEKYVDPVWKIVSRNIKPFSQCESFNNMSQKQKATLILFIMNQALNEVVLKNKATSVNDKIELPNRPNGGRWLATATIYDNGQKRDNKYDGSGPVTVGYSKNNDGKYDCIMSDCQSLFGDAHWRYNNFKYRCSLHSILRFYASFLPCDVTTDNELLYELIPEFEKLCILKKDESGKVCLDIPALTFEEEKEFFIPVLEKVKIELNEILAEEVTKICMKTKHKIPKYVDGREYFMNEGVLKAYAKAQMVAVIEQKLFPYKVVIGKTPLIYIAYKKK